MPDNRRGTWIVTITILIIYFGFILTIGFRPEIFGIPIAEGMLTSVGMVIGTVIMAICIAVAMIYTAVKNKQDGGTDMGPRS